jgi:hypothetical protein
MDVFSSVQSITTTAHFVRDLKQGLFGRRALVGADFQVILDKDSVFCGIHPGKTQLKPLQLVILKKINDITCNEDCLQFDADNARMLRHLLYQSGQLLVQLDRSASTRFSRLTRFRVIVPGC